MILDEPAYLEHYGKKGMKWGVRNANNKLARKQLNSPGAKIGYKIGKDINRDSASSGERTRTRPVAHA